MGRFGLTLLEAKRLTPREFKIYTQAYRVKSEELRRNMAIQAWYSLTVKQEKKVGSKYVPKYESFDQFYNQNKEFYAVFDQEPQEIMKQPTMAEMNRILAKKSREGG